MSRPIQLNHVMRLCSLALVVLIGGCSHAQQKHQASTTSSEQRGGACTKTEKEEIHRLATQLLMAFEQQNLGEARRIGQTQLTLIDRCPSVRSPGPTFAQLGKLELQAGNLQEADHFLGQALRIWRQSQNKQDCPNPAPVLSGLDTLLFLDLADVAQKLGRSKEAYERLQEAIPLSKCAHSPKLEAEIREKLAAIENEQRSR